MNIWWILYIIDWGLFIPILLTTVYLLFFAVCSLFRHDSHVGNAKHKNRFIVLIPAYKADKYILRTVNCVLGQSYAMRNFDVVVISDHQGEIVNMQLAQLPITLLTPNFDYSSKLKSLQYAMLNLPQFKIYDAVIILNASDIIEPEFLEQVNDAYDSAGTKVIQTHRLARNNETSIARLDAIFEEINNAIFRRGHLTVGLSAALGNSGCIFEFQWFKQNIMKIRKTIGEDKELEALLMRDGIFIDYFEDIHIYDLKPTTTSEFNDQRRRWTYMQLHSLVNNLRFLPAAMFGRRHDLTDKIIQWMLVPRTIMIGIISIMSVVLPFVYFSLVIKWWAIAAVLLFAFSMATPNYIVGNRWDTDFLKVPFISISALFNVFRAGRDEAGTRINDFGDMMKGFKRKKKK